MFTISEALPYMDEFVPGLLARFVGATPEQIQALEDEVEHELPETYREFLRVMGVDPGPLFWTMGGADTRIETLMAYYRDIGWRPPERYTLIGRDASLPGSTFLDSGSAPPLAVVSFDVPLPDRPAMADPWRAARCIAASLPELVVRLSFEMFAYVNFALEAYATVEPQPGLLAQLDAALTGLGYVRHPLSGGVTGMYGLEGVGTASTFSAGPDDFATLELMVDDEERAKSVVASLQRVLPVELHSVIDPAQTRPAVRRLRAEVPGWRGQGG